MIRLFTAIALPDRVKQNLMLYSGGLGGARWQREDQLHLTLRFIGEVDERLADDIVYALAAIRSLAFDVTIAELGTFGEKKRPRILWAGVRSNPSLMHLRAKIDTALARVGVPPETRKYHPHVTLAKLDRGAATKQLGEYLARNNTLSLMPFEVDRFHLFSSQLSQSGAIYRIEESFDLAGGSGTLEDDEEDDDLAEFDDFHDEEAWYGYASADR